MWSYDETLDLAIRSLKDLREHFEEQIESGSYEPRSSLPNPVDAIGSLAQALVFLHCTKLAVRNAAEKENAHE